MSGNASMSPGAQRILTTHVGRLPPPQQVVDLLIAQDRGAPYDQEQFDETMRHAVDQSVKLQAEAGIDVPSDGEMSKFSYGVYFRQRLQGLERNPPPPIPRDVESFMEYQAWWIARALGRARQASRESLPRFPQRLPAPRPQQPGEKGPVAVKDLTSLACDIAHLKAALAEANLSEGFLNSVSPGAIAVFQKNEHYPSQEAFLAAIADAMRLEYEMIVNSGLLLQVDCPDLGLGRHARFKNDSEEEFLRHAELYVEALNHALANVPPDRVRLHVCWGYYEGPHVYDIACARILPIVLKARAMALSVEGANPRHEHEWEVWTKIKLPDDKILIPGVIAPSINQVERPELVAQRLMRYAAVVGRERVMAGTDCGFGTFAGFRIIHPSVCWMKLRSLTEGARLASEQLWGAPRKSISLPQEQAGR